MNVIRHRYLAFVISMETLKSAYRSTHVEVQAAHSCRSLPRATAVLQGSSEVQHEDPDQRNDVSHLSVDTKLLLNVPPRTCKWKITGSGPTMSQRFLPEKHQNQRLSQTQMFPALSPPQEAGLAQSGVFPSVTLSGQKFNNLTVIDSGLL